MLVFHSPGQGLRLQVWVSVLWPWHSSPPFWGAGLSHSLTLLLSPPPQPAEHIDHSPNSPHPPSTGHVLISVGYILCAGQILWMKRHGLYTYGWTIHGHAIFDFSLLVKTQLAFADHVDKIEMKECVCCYHLPVAVWVQLKPQDCSCSSIFSHFATIFDFKLPEFPCASHPMTEDSKPVAI